MDVTALIVLIIFIGAIVILCCAAYTYVKFCIKNKRRTTSLRMKVSCSIKESNSISDILLIYWYTTFWKSFWFLLTLKFQPCSDENEIAINREANSNIGSCMECQLIEMGEMAAYSGFCKTCGRSPSVKEWSASIQW